LWGFGEIERTLHRFVNGLAHFHSMRVVVASYKKQTVDGKALGLATDGKGLNGWGREKV
jgi:hypothetical protein